jgi:outer membrane protein assembly factor BamD
MPLKRISKICVVGLSLLLLASGCSALSFPSLPWSTVQPDPTAEALFEEGMDHLKNKRYSRAVDRLQKVKTEFPFSPQLLSAELKLAEAYYLNKQYPEAVSAFKEFQNLHPTNENIPFVVYHLGLAHFDQFTSVDRDQKVTEIAKGYFENVAKSYPNSPYAHPANEKVAKCREYLAEHEFYIASFYMRENKYPAARDRLERILRTYPDTPTAVKSLYEIGESYRLEKNSVKAALAYEALLQHYPESPFSKEARVQLAAVEKEKQDPLKMLLMRDGRPASAPPPEGTQLSSGRSQQKLQELNLIAKKEVVYEEPGQQKGIFRRVLNTLNPFSSSDNRENGAQRAEPQRDPSSKEQPDGFLTSFWKGLNPFAAKERQEVKAAPDPQLVGKVDDSLKEKGIPNDPQSLASKAPTPDLTKIEEEEKPPAANPSALLGDIDVALEKRGKDVNDRPPVPNIHPTLKAPIAEGGKPPAPKVEPAPSQSDSSLISNIDEALKKRGIESDKAETAAPSPQQTRKVQESDREPSTASSQRKIELDTKLTPEKGPLLLESGEYQTPESPVQAEQEKSKAPAEEPDSAKELPKSVVKGPALPTKDQPAETSPASERKKSPEEEEENKGVFDQLREDVGKLRGLLNPFGW